MHVLTMLLGVQRVDSLVCVDGVRQIAYAPLEGIAGVAAPGKGRLHRYDDGVKT